MSHTLTVRLTDEILDWLKETSRRTGIPVARLIREQLETAKSKGGKQRFLRHAGAIADGRPEVSSRKGFARSSRALPTLASSWHSPEGTTSTMFGLSISRSKLPNPY